MVINCLWRVYLSLWCAILLTEAKTRSDHKLLISFLPFYWYLFYCTTFHHFYSKAFLHHPPPILSFAYSESELVLLQSFCAVTVSVFSSQSLTLENVLKRRRHFCWMTANINEHWPFCTLVFLLELSSLFLCFLAVHLVLTGPYYHCYLRHFFLCCGRGLVTSHCFLCQLARRGRTGKAAELVIRGVSYTHSAEAVFSDSLFCNCPNGTLSYWGAG